MLAWRLCIRFFATDLKKIQETLPKNIPTNGTCKGTNELHTIIEKSSVQTNLIKCQQKLLKVAIIGMPNAGKSTFINSLMDRKVCAASNKVHTTRKRSHAIFTDYLTQIVFLDTPGIVSPAEGKRYNLEKSFKNDCKRSINEAHIIGVIHDISNTWTRERLDRKVIRLLDSRKHLPSFLVLNKIDELKSKRKLLDIIRILTNNCLNSIPVSESKRNETETRNRNEVSSWSNFSNVFMISALTGDGIEGIRNYLLKQAQVAEWMYPEKQWTDQTPEDIFIRTVQATLLDFLPQEIPYRLKTELEYFDVTNEGVISASILVRCPAERIRNLVVGVGDGKLRQITEKAQKDLLQTFDQITRLRIVVVTDDK